MEQVLNITKALAEKNRLRVVMAVTDQKELCVCQITELLCLAMPTVSRHLRDLEKADLVKSRKDGRWVYYRLSESFPPLLLRWLKGALVSSDDIATDKQKMNTILACEPGALCKAQQRRRARRAR